LDGLVGDEDLVGLGLEARAREGCVLVVVVGDVEGHRHVGEVELGGPVEVVLKEAVEEGIDAGEELEVVGREAAAFTGAEEDLVPAGGDLTADEAFLAEGAGVDLGLGGKGHGLYLLSE